MNHSLFTKVASCGLLMAWVTHAAAVNTVDFESVASANPARSANSIEDGYANLNWSESFKVITASYWQGSGYQTGTVGDWGAYNSYGAAASFWSVGRDFDFSGAYLTSAWLPSETLVVKGFDDGKEVYSRTVSLKNTRNANGTPNWFSFDWQSIDKVTFSGMSEANARFVIDQIQLQMPTAVPEPESYLLMATGLAVLSVRSYRHRKTP